MTSPTSKEIITHRLDNGLTVLFEPMPWLRSISLGIYTPMGASGDPAGQDGSAVVLSEWSGRGAGSLDSRSYSAALDALGVRRGSQADRSNSSVAASMLVDTLPQALPLLASQVTAPQLQDAEFENARQAALQELASLQDQPSARLSVALARATFRSGHGRSPLGSEEGLAALTPDSVRADRLARHGADGSLLAVAGGIDWPELLKLAEEHLGGWGGKAAAALEPEFADSGEQHISADTSQVQIGMSFRALPADHPDWQLQSLATLVLSGGMGARLFTEVREKRGLVYNVGAAVRAVRGAGYLIGVAGTTPQKAQETIDVMLAEFRKLKDGVSKEELERAKQGKLTSLIMQGESSSSRVSGLAGDWFLRGEASSLSQVADEVRAVSLDELNAWLAAGQLPEPVVVTLGPDRTGDEQ